jgi:pimeloyl-ACP methyl ester carboxylesterase
LQTGKHALRHLLRDLKQFAPAPAAPAYSAAKQQVLRLAALRAVMLEARSEARSSLQHASSGLKAALGSIACPTLFALSRNHREYPLKRFLDLLDPSLAWAPQHKFTVFAGAFHPLWDEPERFTQAVTGFLQTQLPLEAHTHAWLISAVDYPTRNMNTWKCVHPDCGAERVLPVGRNANDSKQSA